MNIQSVTVIDVMDLILEILGGHSFFIAIDPLDTVLDVKEKVQNFQHIPISHQTFFFDGQLLQDDLHLWGSQIDRIHVLVAADDAAKLEPQPTPQLQLPQLSSYQYNLLEMPPSNPSPQLFPTPYDYDRFGMPEFSSSTQLMPMPFSNRKELEELPPIIDLPPSNIKKLEESLLSLDMLPSNTKELDESVPSIDMMPSNTKEWDEMLLSLDTVPSPPQPPSRPKVTGKVKVPPSKDPILIETDSDSDSDSDKTVLNLKEKIVARQDMQGVPVERIALETHSTPVELLDHQTPKGCAVSDNPKIDVFKIPSLPVSGKLKVTVLPMRTTDKIDIEVNAEDKVSVLREELEKLHRTLRFRLPQDGLYFFIHRQSVMFEEQSFHWHQVRHGDTIDTFDGFVSTQLSPLLSKLHDKRIIK